MGMIEDMGRLGKTFRSKGRKSFTKSATFGERTYREGHEMKVSKKSKPIDNVSKDISDSDTSE